jgi:hypothetical protein
MGVSITSLYCQGKLCKIGFTVHPCCNDVNKGGCCETKSILLKVVDSFVKESNDAPFKVFNFENEVLSYLSLPFKLVNSTSFKAGTEHNWYETLSPGIYTYLRLCTFRL